MSQENVGIMRSAIDAWNRGDRAEALASYAPEVEWHTSGEFVDERVYRGRAGLERLWAELEEDLEELSILVSEIRGVGDEVFVTVTFTGRGKRSKARFEQSFWYTVTFRDGLIVRVKSHADPTPLEAAGPPE